MGIYITQEQIDGLLDLYSVTKKLSNNPMFDEKKLSNCKSEYQMMALVFSVLGIDPDEELRKENR